MISVQLGAVDTLHLRSSVPYTASLTSPEHLSGHFPPHPQTVVGAVRAWLARGNGWRGGPWRDDLKRVLGDGDDLGPLRFDGPYLLRKAESGEVEPLYTLPAHLLGEVVDNEGGEGQKWIATAQLLPGQQVMCDLGDEVRLPEPIGVDAARPWPKPGKELWLTRTGMEAVLRGELPPEPEVVRSDALWSAEPRVGIERDDQTRTVAEHKLYTSKHARPARNVTVGVRVEGVPEGWVERCGRTVPLGGEGRWAECQPWEDHSGSATPLAEIRDSSKVLVVALTPIDADEDLYRVGGQIAELGGATIVSACLPRAERIGGWSNHGNQRGPRELRSMLPAGSVLFCDVGDPERLRAAVERTSWPPRIGARQEWGFGAVAVGLWQDTVEVGK